MNTLVFAAPKFHSLRAALEHPQLESAAILLCAPVQTSTGEFRLLVRDVFVATDADYAHRTSVRAELHTSFCLPIETKARADSLALVYVHTHPGSAQARFSPVDDETERSMLVYLQRRGPNAPHAALLLAQDGVNARMLGTNEPLRVLEVGASLLEHFGSGAAPAVPHGRFDRQVRAFGAEGQHRLSRMCLAIVGLGGTGSLTAQQAAHLGVNHFLLVDSDVIEDTNLNRVVGACKADVGKSKVEVAKRLILAINPDAQVDLLEADVAINDVAKRVVEADLVFCCTDSQGSRHVLNGAAYQHLTPVIDMGVSIHVAVSGKTRFDGHVKLLAPGQACLWCANNLDSEQVRRDLMTEQQRAHDRYVQGASEREPQPSVISLNSTVSSIAMTMMLSVVCGVPAAPRYVVYQGNRARLSETTCAPNDDCPYCGSDAPLGWGNGVPLLGRSQ